MATIHQYRSIKIVNIYVRYDLGTPQCYPQNSISYLLYLGSSFTQCYLLILFWLKHLDLLLVQGHTSLVFRRFNSWFLASDFAFVLILQLVPRNISFFSILNRVYIYSDNPFRKSITQLHPWNIPLVGPWIITFANPLLSKSFFRFLFKTGLEICPNDTLQF